MYLKRQFQRDSSNKRLLVTQQWLPEPEEPEIFDLGPISDDEILAAIRYLDPDLEPSDEPPVVIVSDAEVRLAIQYLDPDFN